MEIKKEIIWLAGGDGLIGNHLTNAVFSDEFHWLIFTRKIKKSHRPNVEYVLWNTETQTIPDDILRPDHIINLAGEGTNCDGVPRLTRIMHEIGGQTGGICRPCIRVADIPSRQHEQTRELACVIGISRQLVHCR